MIHQSKALLIDQETYKTPNEITGYVEMCWIVFAPTKDRTGFCSLVCDLVVIKTAVFLYIMLLMNVRNLKSSPPCVVCVQILSQKWMVSLQQLTRLEFCKWQSKYFVDYYAIYGGGGAKCHFFSSKFGKIKKNIEFSSIHINIIQSEVTNKLIQLVALEV